MVNKELFRHKLKEEQEHEAMMKGVREDIKKQKRLEDFEEFEEDEKK